MARPREHTHEEFVDAAIRIVDTEGLDALTVRRLGKEVGVSYTAVYTYFATREDLMVALVGRVSADLISGFVARGESVRDQLITMALTVRRALAGHPHLAGAFVSAANGASHGNEATLLVVGLLEEAGLRGRRLAVAYRIIEGYVFGTSVFDLGAAPRHLSIRCRRYAMTGRPEFEAIATSDRAIEEHNDEAFRLGFELILDGLGI
jgi:AcrR family transcriptional regulator